MTAWLGEMNIDAKNASSFFLLVTILLYFLEAPQIRDTRHQTSFFLFLVFPPKYFGLIMLAVMVLVDLLNF